MPLPLLPRNIKDPTAQDARVRACIDEFKRRCNRIGKEVKGFLDRQQHSVITLNALDIEVKKYNFNISEAEYNFIGSEMDDMIDRIILENGDQASLWLMKGFVQPAYQQGTAMAWVSLKVQSKDYRLSRPDLTSILTSPAYRRRLGYIKAREFEEMKGFAGDMKKNYRLALLDGMAQGINPNEIARNVKGVTEKTISRARRIARTEITTALKRARLDEAEDTAERLSMKIMMMQMSALSPTTRASHARRHAKLFTFEQARAWMSTSPNMINCYLPGTMVAGSFVGGSEAIYNGLAVRIMTASGRVLSVTPNHPVMTSFGLVPAAEIKEGFNLVAYDGDREDPIGVCDLNGKLVYSKIEDVIGSLVEVGHSQLSRVSAVDFYGDGASIDGDVRVIRSDRVLPFGLNTPAAKLLDELKFVKAYPAGAHRGGSGAANLEGVFLPATLDVGIVGERAPLIGSHLACAVELGLTSPASDEAQTGKPIVKALTPHAGLATDLEDGFPSHVLRMKVDNIERAFFDSVLSVELFHYDGLVYDVEEISGLMLAQGLVAGNCKCSFTEVLVGDDGKPLTPAIINKAEAMVPEGYKPVPD